MEAIELLEHGLSVFPLQNQSKRPAVSSWGKYQTEYITDDVFEHHQGNWGIATGELSGITVVDADTVEAIRWIDSNLPPTPYRVQTQNGVHYYYRHNGETNQRMSYLPPKETKEGKIDIRGQGGYVVAEGSFNENGFQYKPIIDSGFEGFEDLPKLKPDKVAPNKPKFKASATLEVLKGNITEGNRNNLLSTVIYRLAINDFKYSESLAIANALNAQQEQPLSSVEVYKLVEGKYKLKAQGKLQKYLEVEDLSEILKSKQDESKYQLPEPEGLLLDLKNYILCNSFLLQPAFALASGLGIISALAGNIWKFDGIAPNVYLFAIGKSGTGKNAPMRFIKSILAGKLNRTNLVGAGKYASSVSIIEDLPNNRERIDVIDEASAQFEMATKFGAGSFQSAIIETLNELYTSSLTKFAGERSRTHGVTGSCWNPYVSLYATTTPEGFKSFFSKSLIAKGIGGRISIFIGEDQPVMNTTKDEKTFKGKDALCYLAGLRPIMREDIPLPAEMPIEENARAYWNDYKRNRVEYVFSLNDGLERTIHAREVEQANKFTQLHALGRNPRNPQITIIDIEFGTKLAENCLKTLNEILKDNISQNNHEAMIKEVTAKIKELESPTKEELQKALLHIRVRELDECLTTLTDTKEVFAIRTGNVIKYCHSSLIAL